MAILDITKKGYMTIKTAAGYVKLLPRTLATLVAMSDGKSVEEKITELNSNLNKFPIEPIDVDCIFSSTSEGTYQNDKLKGKLFVIANIRATTGNLGRTVVLIANRSTGWQTYQNASYNISGNLHFNSDTGTLRYSISSITGWSANSFKIATIIC